MKNIAFTLFCLIIFQTTSYAMETTAKALKVRQFLLDLKVDLPNEKASTDAITHFNKKESGIPIFIKKEKELSTNKYTNHSHSRIDKYGTIIVAELRKNTQIPPETNIHVIEKDFYYKNFFKEEEWAPTCYSKVDNNNKLHYFIQTNSWFNNNQSIDTIRSALAHELAHLERGFLTPHRNSLLAKTVLGGIGLITCGLLLKNSDAYTRLLGCGCGLGALQSIAGKLFENYFQRKEEKACDLRAIELTKTDKGVEEYFSLKPSYGVLFCGKNWAIGELIIENKPSTYTRWNDTHSCQAERINYCKTYAQQLGYHYRPAGKKFAFPEE